MLETDPPRLLPPCEATLGFTGRILYRLSCARHGMAGALTDGFHSLPRRPEHGASRESTRPETQAPETSHKEAAGVRLHRVPPFLLRGHLFSAVRRSDERWAPGNALTPLRPESHLMGEALSERLLGYPSSFCEAHIASQTGEPIYGQSAWLRP
jgi:hypothetical protein